MRDEPPRLDNRSATSPQFDSGRRGPRKKKNSEKISELVCTVVQGSTICGLLECLIRAIKYAVTYADPMPYGPPPVMMLKRLSNAKYLEESACSHRHFPVLGNAFKFLRLLPLL
jgi:hypothetical protein